MTKGSKSIGHERFTEIMNDFTTDNELHARQHIQAYIEYVSAEDVKAATCYGTVHSAHTIDSFHPKAASTACLSSMPPIDRNLDAQLGDCRRVHLTDNCSAASGQQLAAMLMVLLR